MPPHSLLLSKGTKGAATLNIPMRRTNLYQQYYMPSQHIYCGSNPTPAGPEAVMLPSEQGRRAPKSVYCFICTVAEWLKKYIRAPEQAASKRSTVNIRVLIIF